MLITNSSGNHKFLRSQRVCLIGWVEKRGVSLIRRMLFGTEPESVKQHAWNFAWDFSVSLSREASRSSRARPKLSTKRGNETR